MAQIEIGNNGSAKHDDSVRLDSYISGFELDELIRRALKEDMPFGDVTTESLISSSAVSRAYFEVRTDGVIAGLDIAARVFRLLDEKIAFRKLADDGAHVAAGFIAAEAEGPTRALLKGERTALNYLQRLSGIATAVDDYCREVAGLPVKVTDTRKTTPGLRALEKYAVRAGGGHNHRFSLSDGVLIKDNHIKAVGSINKAIAIAKEKIPHTLKIEVETETLDQVLEALDCGADIIMLDNMDVATMKKAVVLINGRALVEASGSIKPEEIKEIALTGVDIISVGRITHSAPALDISMEII